jgi:hypothetical protein
MRNSFTEAGFLSGIRDPNQPEPEDTENRSWGTFAKDVAIDVSRPVVALGQTAAIGARELGVPGAGSVAETLSDAGNAMESARSPRARALDTLSVMPGPNDRSFWREPVAGSVHAMLGTVPFAAAALATGGASVPAQVGMAALAGVQGAGEGINQLDDFARRTPLNELMTLEPFKAAMREFNGDEQAARQKLFKDSLDWKATAASFAANSAEFGALLHGVTRGASTGIKALLGRALVGGAEGAASGVAETVTDAYTEQLGKVRTGQQQAIDTGEMAGAVGKGAIFGAPVAAMHAVGGRSHAPAPKIDDDTKSVATDQINQPPSPAGPGAPPQQAVDTGWPGQPEQPAAPGNMEPGAGPSTPPPQAPPPTPPAGPPPRPPAGPAPAGPAAAPPAGAGPAQAGTAPPLTSEVGDYASTFKTSMGSEYFVFPDGTTVRNRASRGDQYGEGLQARSALTIFTTPGHAHVLMQRLGRPTRFAKQLEMTKGGRLGIQFTEGPSAGKFVDGSLGRVSQTPQIGLSPIEIWKGGTFHFGHEITEIGEGPAAAAEEAPAAPAQPSPEVTETPPAAPQAPSVTRVPLVSVPDVTRAQQEPAKIGAVEQDDVRAIMMGVTPAVRQEASAALQNRLQRMGRLTGADLPPALTERMTPDDVAVLRSAVETDPVTAIEMVRTTPDDQVQAAYEGHRQRYAKPPDAATAAPEREPVPKPPALKSRFDLPPGPYDRQEAAEARRLAGIREQVVPPVEAEIAAERPVQQRQNTVQRRLQKLRERSNERRARGRAAMAGRAERGRDTEGTFRQIDTLARQYDERNRPPLYEAGPTDEERQFLSDTEAFNTRVKRELSQDQAMRPQLTREREALVQRGQELDRQRADRGADQPLARSVPQLPEDPRQTSTRRFNDLVAKADKFRDQPIRALAVNREVIEAFQQMMATNAERGRLNRLPMPSWLYDAMTYGRERVLAEISADSRARLAERQAQYAAQRERLLAAKKAVVKPQMRPVTIDVGARAHAAFVAAWEGRTGRQREYLRTKAQESITPVEPKAAKALVYEEVERRFEEAQERVAEGGPLNVPGTELITKAEAVKRLDKYLKDETQRARTAATREGQYNLRDKTIDLSLREAINRRFGSVEKFDEFLTQMFQSLSKNLPKRPAEDLLDVPLPLSERRGMPQGTHSYRDRYEHQVDQYYKAKLDQMKQGARLKKFLEFALDKINKNLKEYKSEIGIRGKGSIKWELPEGKFNKNTNRSAFNIGSSEDQFAVYGIANDLQKLHEELRFQFEGLQNVDKGLRTRVPEVGALFHRTGQPTTLAQELRKYMGPLRAFYGNFVKDMKTYLQAGVDAEGNFDYSKITSERKARSSETTAKYLEGQTTPIERDDVSREDILDTVPDPRAANEEALVGQIDRKIEQARREAEQGSNAPRTYQEMMRRYEQMRRERAAMPVKKFTGTVRRAMGSFDEKGLPVDRYEREFVTDNSEYDKMITDGYEQLETGPGEPVHPLISPPVSTRDALGRAAEIVRDGQAPNVPQQYINQQFLDKLANITEGAKVYHAPYDVVSWGHMEAPAHYMPALDRIIMSADISPELYARAVIHETSHAATEGLLTNDARFAADVRGLLSRAIGAARYRGVDLDRLPRDLYGLTNPSEFIAETISNQKFRDFLESVKTPTNPVIQGARNAINALYRAIRDAFRRVIGAYDANTALDTLYYDQSTVLGRADKMVKRGLSKVAREGRQAWRPPVEGDPKLYDDGRYYLRLSGVQAFGRDLNDNLRGYVQQTAEHAKYVYETRDKNRGFGLSWHTLADMTHRGSTEFQGITKNLFKTIEQVFATRANTIRNNDQPKLEKVARFFNKLDKGTRQRVQEFLLDESYHGFFADAYLYDKKNGHFADTLANEQVRQAHNSMMTEYRALKQIDGFDEVRTLLHGWGEERELQIRSSRIRNLLDHSGLIPDTLTDPVERGRLVQALENLVDHKKALAASDAAIIRQHLKSVDDPAVVETLKAINNVEDIRRIPGPYIPFTRRGNYAVSGDFILPVPAGAQMLDPAVNRQTGKPQNNPRVVFNTEAEAEDYVKKITRDLGITQIGGGTIDIDQSTGARPKIEKDGKMVTARGKDLEEVIKRGANVQKKFYVQFQTKLLEFHPTEYEAEKAAKVWSEAHKGALRLAPVQDVYRHDARQNEQYVGAQLEKMIRRMRATASYQRLLTTNPEEAAAIMDSLNLAAATYVMRRGVKQRYLPRGYVKGASTDITNTFKEYSSMTAGYIAKLQHGTDIAKYSKEMRDYLDSHTYEAGGNKNALVNQRIYTAYMTRLHSPTMNPRDTFLNRTVDRALRYTMLDKLPSIAYFTINATEPSVIGAPLMTGRHTAGRVYGAMASMYKLAAASRFMTDETGSSIKLPSFAAAGWKDLKAASKPGEIRPRTDYRQLFSQRVQAEPDAAGLNDLFDQASARGIFDASASLEYDRAFANAPLMVDRVADYLQNIFMAANTAVENLNRFVTVGTAYRLERARLGEAADAHQKAVDYAIEISHQANGQYANYNAPERFNTGPFARMLFQFKKYPQRIIANYIRATVNTFGKDPVLRRQGMRQLGFMLATQMMVAGVMGLPLEPFTIPINTMHIMGVIPYNADDVQAGWRQWAARNFGPQVGEILMHGPLRLTGADVGSRLSQASLATFGSPASTKAKDLEASLFTMMAGAAGSTGFEVLTGLQKMNEGIKALSNGSDNLAYKKFGEAAQHLILFRTANDVLAAINRSDPEGMRTQSGRMMREPYSPGEALVRATGFQPAREAESQEARRAIKQATDRLKTERKGLIDQWVQSSPASQQSMMGTIRSYNEGKPTEQRITVSDLMKAQGTRRKAEKEGTGTLGLAVDRQMKSLLPDAGAYVTR